MRIAKLGEVGGNEREREVGWLQNELALGVVRRCLDMARCLFFLLALACQAKNGGENAHSCGNFRCRFISHDLAIVNNGPEMSLERKGFLVTLVGLKSSDSRK